jgi:hypothetical protein
VYYLFTVVGTDHDAVDFLWRDGIAAGAAPRYFNRFGGLALVASRRTLRQKKKTAIIVVKRTRSFMVMADSVSDCVIGLGFCRQ